MEESGRNRLLTVIYVLTVLSAALLVAAVVMFIVGSRQEPLQGDRGSSAYEIAVKNGFKGSESDWLESLKGEKGDQGEKGEQGDKGDKGDRGDKGVGVQSVVRKSDKWDILSWLEITYSDGTKSDTKSTPTVCIDPDKSYQAETEEERGTLMGYGVSPEKIFTAAEASDRLKRGGTLQAQSDLTIEPFTFSEDAAIELNGHTLTVDGTASLQVGEGKSLRIEGGALETTAGDAIAPQRAIFLTGRGSSLLLKDLVYDGDSPVVCPVENSKVCLKNCQFTTKGYYALSTNATYGENMQITVEESTLSALRGEDGDSCALLVNVPCRLTVKGSTLKGSRQGLVVRCGTASVEDSLVIATGEYPEKDKYLNENWSQGNEVPACGLVIGNRGYAAYQSPADVTLKNTEVKAEGAVAAVYLYGNADEEKGASLTYDDACRLGQIAVGGGSVTVNGEKQEAVFNFPFLFPNFFPRRKGI